MWDTEVALVFDFPAETANAGPVLLKQLLVQELQSRAGPDHEELLAYLVTLGICEPDELGTCTGEEAETLLDPDHVARSHSTGGGELASLGTVDETD